MAMDRQSAILPYNSRIIRVYVRLLEQRYASVDLGKILDYAGMKYYEVSDEGHWFSQEQVDRFYKMAVELTGNPTIAREAGRFASSSETGTLFRRYILGFLGPAKAYEMLERASTLITQSSRFSVRRIGSHAVEVISMPNPDIEERPFQCENRLGILESISMTFTKRLPKVKQTACVFEGAPFCRYEIEWEPTLLIPLRRIRYGVAAFSSLLAGVLAFMLPAADWLILSLVLLSTNLILTLSVKYGEYARMQETIEELRQSTEDLALQMKINYNNTTVSHEVGEAVSKFTRIEDVLENVVRIFEKLMNYDRGIIMLVDRSQSKLQFRHGFGYSDKHLKMLLNTEFDLSKEGSRGVFVVSFKEKRSFLVNSLHDIEADLSRRSLAFARLIGTQSFICCPIVCEGESLGVLAVDNIHSKQPLLNSDLNMLKGIASVIGMSIKNAKLIESREDQFKSIIEVLASSIDARDNLTSGHSEMVTEYSVGISHEMGMSKEFQEMIRIAALLHDYGKIGVPDSILKKQGSLTPQEFAVIKTHAEKTKQILDQIAFDGIYSQVPEVASSHHERLDGKGYPRGLKGNEIPLGARIIAVADFYDAITSQRHYREPLMADEALELLMNEADDHLDRRVIAAFFHYLKKNNLIKHEPDFTERLA